MILTKRKFMCLLMSGSRGVSGGPKHPPPSLDNSDYKNFNTGYSWIKNDAYIYDFYVACDYWF